MLWDGVKVRRVIFIHDFGLVWSLVVAYPNIPVDRGEEGMALDLLSSVLANTMLRVREELLDEVASCWRHLGVKGDAKVLRPVDYLELSLRGGRSHERWLTNQHLVHDDPHGPPVAQMGIANPSEDLRSNVVRGTDQ